MVEFPGLTFKFPVPEELKHHYTEPAFNLPQGAPPASRLFLFFGHEGVGRRGLPELPDAFAAYMEPVEVDFGDRELAAAASQADHDNDPSRAAALRLAVTTTLRFPGRKSNRGSAVRSGPAYGELKLHRSSAQDVIAIMGPWRTSTTRSARTTRHSWPPSPAARRRTRTARAATRRERRWRRRRRRRRRRARRAAGEGAELPPSDYFYNYPGAGIRRFYSTAGSTS